MRGPSQHRWEPAFRAWYGRDVSNAEAYDRLNQRWRAAANAADRRAAPAHTIAGRSQPRMALVAVMALAAVSVSVIALNVLPPFVESVGAAELTVETRTGETRRVTLDDGSRLTIEPQSKVRVKLDRSVRRVAVDKGRIRIEPAKDRRPLVVSGDRDVVVSDAAAVDVSVEGGHLVITSLDGSASDAARTSLATPLQATATTIGVLEFDREPLSSAIARANHGSPIKLVLADGALGKERLTGQFRAGDVEGLASGLAAAFALTVERPSTSIVVLRRRESAPTVRK